MLLRHALRGFVEQLAECSQSHECWNACARHEPDPNKPDWPYNPKCHDNTDERGCNEYCSQCELSGSEPGLSRWRESLRLMDFRQTPKRYSSCDRYAPAAILMPTGDFTKRKNARATIRGNMLLDVCPWSNHLESARKEAHMWWMK